MIYKAYRFDDIPQQVTDDIHAVGVMGMRKRIDTPPLLCYNETNNTKGGIIMKKADVHVIVAMLATLVSMFTVMAMMFMRFFG